jgi:hypothetical protein
MARVWKNMSPRAKGFLGVALCLGAAAELTAYGLAFSRRNDTSADQAAASAHESSAVGHQSDQDTTE